MTSNRLGRILVSRELFDQGILDRHGLKLLRKEPCITMVGYECLVEYDRFPELQEGQGIPQYDLVIELVGDKEEITEIIKYE